MPGAITVTIGWSAAAQAAVAGKEAAAHALEQQPLTGQKLALVFGSSWFDQGPLLAGVRSVLGDIPLAGASTAGEITPEGPVSHTCVVVLIGSETLTWSLGLGEAVDRVPREAGQQAAYMALRDCRSNQRIGFLVFGDGLATGYSDVIRGIQEVLGNSSLIVGGLAADDLRFFQTYQYCNDRVVSRALVGILLAGPGRLGVGIEHGFAPISKPRQITHAHANLVFELDHQPAASVYEEYFGADLVQRMRREGLTRQGIAYPLGIHSEDTDKWLLRNVVAFQDDGSLSCSGEMLEGAWLQLMIGSRDLALEAAYRAAQQAIRPLNHIAGVLIFDSAMRRKLLGPRHAALEIAKIREAIGPTIPMAGCYTYGEQAPFGSAMDARTALQTGSVLVVALGT